LVKDQDPAMFEKPEIKFLDFRIYAFFDALHNFVLDSSTTCTNCGHVSTNQGETKGILSIELRPRIPEGDLSDYLDKYMSYSVTDYKCEKCKDTAEKQRTRQISTKIRYQMGRHNNHILLE
jgi:uncharacterized UBP type Zn finger protein